MVETSNVFTSGGSDNWLFGWLTVRMIDCSDDWRSDNRRSTLPMLENLLYKIISRPTYVVYLPGKRILLVVYKHWITSARICNTLTLKTRSTEPPNTEHYVPNCVGFTVACLPRLHWAICGCELYFFPSSACLKRKKIYRTKGFCTIHPRQLDEENRWKVSVEWQADELRHDNKKKVIQEPGDACTNTNRIRTALFVNSPQKCKNLCN